MSRMPYAMEQLVEQVGDHFPDAEYTLGEPDGFDVVRSVRFDKDTSEELAPAFEHFLDDDERVEEWHKTDSGYVHVKFVNGPAAESREEFDLDAGLEVAAQPEETRLHSVKPEAQAEESEED